ncbi:MAG TPA: site-specific integrase [Candidatus Limnocylindrales bacterium]|nr:site-specific integrase [Candidatus Limnocylindrales bacterium]
MISAAYADWMQAKQVKWSPRMYGIAENSWKHLCPIFGKRLVVDVEPRDIRRYQQARTAAGASNRTVNIEVDCLRAVLKRHGAWERIRPGVETLPERDDVGHALSQAEEIVLLAECGNSRSRLLLPFVVLAIETAARYGTVRRLQWRNVDFAHRCLTFGKDKTRAGSNRTVPLTPRALETLTFWAQQFPERRPEHFVFPYERCGTAGAEGTFGFTGASVYDTDPTRPTGSIKKAWEQARMRTQRHCPECHGGRLEQSECSYACTACGWTVAELPRALSKLRLHDLRHSGVSRMINARVPLPIIAKIVGWSPGTLAKMSARYGHFSVEEMRSALDSIGRDVERFSESPKNSPKWPTEKSSGIQ